jgi:hypothetical protein
LNEKRLVFKRKKKNKIKEYQKNEKKEEVQTVADPKP